MAIPSIYINLEDDVSKVVQRLKKEKATAVVLVCPKRCLLFSDSINLRLLKKQVDLLEKEVFILTMDERGQMYAKEAGFQLKFLPKSKTLGSISDIRVAKPKIQLPEEPPMEKKSAVTDTITSTVTGLKNLVSKAAPKLHASKPKPKEKPQTPPTLEVRETVYPQELYSPQQKHATRYPKATMGFAALALIVILLLAFVILPHATVTVYPKTEPLTRDWDLTLTTNVNEPDPSKLILPATKVAETMEVRAKFQSQGKKEVGNKAAGSIRIYNFTGSPLNLKASTTTFTIGNKNYAILQDLTGIKPTTYKNSATKEVNESSLMSAVDIVAASGGEGYNVPAGTRMEISNQVFGSRPQLLYAKTETAITGGTSRFLSLITELDIASAQNTLAEQALNKLKDNLQTQNLMFPDKSYVIENLGFTTDKQVGTESPSFEASLKVKISGLAFNLGDLQQLITERINQTLSSGKTLQMEHADQAVYKLKTIDLNAETGLLSVHFEGKVVLNINLDDVTSELVGKSEAQVNEILRSKAEVEKIEITLAPSWQKSFPFLASKIDIRVVKE